MNIYLASEDVDDVPEHTRGLGFDERPEWYVREVDSGGGSGWDTTGVTPRWSFTTVSSGKLL